MLLQTKFRSCVPQSALGQGRLLDIGLRARFDIGNRNNPYKIFAS